jgi:hypothetical protein
MVANTKPITREELTNLYPPSLATFDVERVLSLFDDRERLRELILKAEWEGNTSRDPEPACPWCEADKFGTPRETHQPDCPAFSAAGVVR